MKNLPEDKLFNSVENRLRNYSELPDDEGWDRISRSISSFTEPQWTIWTNRTAATLSLVILFFLFYRENVFHYDKPQTSSSSSTPNDKKRTEAAQSTISKTEIMKQEPSRISNPASNALSINSFPRSKYAGEQKAMNISSMQSVIAEIQKDERQLSKSPINDTADNLIVETFKTDSILIEVAELSIDSPVFAGHVLPPTKKRKRANLTFYSMISPALSFQHATPETSDGVVVDRLNSPGVMSQERFGFTIETGVQGLISDRFQYIVGLSYYQQSQRLSYEEKSDGTVIESGDDFSFDIKPAATTQTFDYSMRNVGIQAGVIYTLKLQGLMHKAGVMLQYQKGVIQADEDDVYDNSSSDYLNYQVLYRVEYAFRSGVGFFVQPAYTHSIIANESLDAPFKLKQSRASLGVGIVYRF